MIIDSDKTCFFLLSNSMTVLMWLLLVDVVVVVAVFDKFESYDCFERTTSKKFTSNNYNL